MGFLDSFSSILGVVYDAVAAVFQQKPSEETPQEGPKQPKQEGDSTEGRRTQDSKTKPATESDSARKNAWKPTFPPQSESTPDLSVPFGEIKVNRWCSWTMPGRPAHSVLVYGCSTTGGQVWRLGFPYPDPHQRDLWFHGTDYESVLNIIENGVQLKRGKGHQDFSYRDGFYLSPDSENAIRWACNDKRERPAVIVFRVPLQAYQGLDLEYNRSDWEGIVRYNRSGRIVELSKHVRRETVEVLNTCDYITGPIGGMKDKPTNREGWESWVPSGFNNPFRQLCVKSEALSKDFGDVSNIESIIFY